jgi:hypothetical protein
MSKNSILKQKYNELKKSYSNIIMNVKSRERVSKNNIVSSNKLSKNDIEKIKELIRNFLKYYNNHNPINTSNVSVKPNPNSNNTTELLPIEFPKNNNPINTSLNVSVKSNSNSNNLNNNTNLLPIQFPENNNLRIVDEYWSKKIIIGDGSCLFHAIIGYYRHMNWPLKFDDDSNISASLLRGFENPQKKIIAEMGYKLRRDVLRYVNNIKIKNSMITFDTMILNNTNTKTKTNIKNIKYIRFSDIFGQINITPIDDVIRILHYYTEYAGETELPYIASYLKKNIVLLNKTGNASNNYLPSPDIYTILQIYVFKKPLRKNNTIFLFQSGIKIRKPAENIYGHIMKNNSGRNIYETIDTRHFETLIPNKQYRLKELFDELDRVDLKNKFIIQMDNNSKSRKNRGSYIYSPDLFLEIND